MDNNRLENILLQEEFNFLNQHNLGLPNIDRDLGIKLVIQKYDGEMQLEIFMD